MKCGNDADVRVAQRAGQTLAEPRGIGALLFAAPLGIGGCPRGYRGRLASIADKGPLRIEYGKAGKDIPFLWPAPHARMLVQERESFRHRLQYRQIVIRPLLQLEELGEQRTRFWPDLISRHRARARHGEKDRKSTRLNSSH